MKNRRFKFSNSKPLFGLLILISCFSLTLMSYSETVVSVAPAPLTVPEVGEHLTLHVNITGGEAVAGYQFTVAFDPSVLRYVAANNADYLPADAFAVPMPENERITFVTAARKDTPLGNGDGTLATLTFEVLTAKAYGVHLTDVMLSDATATALAVQWQDTRLDGSMEVFPAERTSLLRNYPNPFNPETWIPYQLVEPADVTLTIYEANGTLVRTLALGHQAAGIYQSKNRAAYWDGRNEIGERVASGLYFYTLRAGDWTATSKMLIVK